MDVGNAEEETKDDEDEFRFKDLKISNVFN